VYALVVDPQNSRTLYASTDRGLFKTRDGGASWVEMNSPKGLNGWGLSLAIDPQTSGTIYAGLSGDRVYKSTDGGETWTAPSAGMEDYFNWTVLPGSLAIDPQNPATLYAAMHHGVYKSTDGGASWRAATAGLPLGLDDVRMLAFDPKKSATVYAACRGDVNGGGVFVVGGAYKSTDGGITWRAVNVGLPSQNLDMESLVIDPQSPDTIYAGTNSGIFKSTDGGASWSAANAGLPPFFGFVSLAIDPHDTSTVYTTLQSPRPTIGVRQDQSGYSLGVFKSTDGGASWVSVGLQDSISVIAIDPQNSCTLYAASTSGLGIRKSIDRAATWKPSSVGLRGLTVNAFAVDPQDTSRIYAVTYAGVFKTTNSGASWTEANSGLPVDELLPLSLAIDPQNPGTLYVGMVGRGIFKSTDGAANWSYSGLGGNLNLDQSLVVDPRNSGTVYAAGFSGGFKSTDGGATWEPKHFGGSLVAIDPRDSSTLYAADIWDGRTLFKSKDAGETWSPLATPPGFAALAEEAPDISVLLVDPQDRQTIYAGGLFSGLIKSKDGGDSWEAVNFGMPSVFVDRSSSVTALAIDPRSNTIYAASGSVMLKSTDGAVTWTSLNAIPVRASIQSLTIDARDPNRLYAGTDYGVFAITFVP
jgi:photosystem II stability/assembly factor-like uncharacterized protein